MEYLLPYLSLVTVPHIMVELERMLDYRGVGLERFHCTGICAVLPCSANVQFGGYLVDSYDGMVT